jgi:hypothetical protein
MRSRWWAALALAGIALAGCGDSGATGPGNKATCGRGALTLVGELDGRAFDVHVSTNGGSLLFQQASLPYTLDVDYNGGTLHLEWSTAVSVNGSASPATGTLVMPTGGPYVGEGLCGASGTISESDPDTDPFTTNYPFTLRTVSRCPNFTGTTLAGGIDGCVGN